MYWYHEDLQRLEKEIAGFEKNPKLIFYGSSTFTLWSELTTIFKEYHPANLGFGGSTLASCTWFFDRLFENIDNIEAIIIYAGENDLGEGRHPEEVILFLENLLHKIRAKYGNIPCTYISIKPSINRWHLAGSIRFTNSNIQKLMAKNYNLYFLDIYDLMLTNEGTPNPNYYIEDGLHLTPAGYELWTEVIKKHLELSTIKLQNV
ncbi:GDSL-type esterase/lipase family protein [Flavobacterium sp. NG2]|uniref:GDSL-type esterase/lipase family protein n=1 Tax=Flavobacterium sp. NG2 TaxID=3097547 RepID=UPI002A80C9D1|nr:GDSL-type esterase/lipase family protein [Flavobacterium sp. NG2]WPR70648.1 GDSL-type esterase/lipase family protein [Flavobacterium sp. NG2]